MELDGLDAGSRVRASPIHDQIRFPGRYTAPESPNLFQRNVHGMPIGPVAQPDPSHSQIRAKDPEQVEHR